MVAELISALTQENQEKRKRERGLLMRLLTAVHYNSCKYDERVGELLLTLLLHFFNYVPRNVKSPNAERWVVSIPRGGFFRVIFQT